MLTYRNDFASAQVFIRKLRGTSEPILVHADDGLLYVVKFLNNPQGPNTLFNEGAGSDLYRVNRLHAPPWKPLLITDAFLDRYRGAWLGIDRTAVRPQAGLCFGSLYLGVDGRRLFEVLSRASLSRIANRASFWLAWVIDACANHVDHRQAIFAERPDGRLTAYFIDHGHLFGGPYGLDRMPPVGFRFLDPLIYPDLDGDERQAFLKTIQSVDLDWLRRRVRALPEDWKTASALSGFERCLDDLANSTRLTDIVNGMVNARRPAGKARHSSPRAWPKKMRAAA